MVEKAKADDKGKAVRAPVMPMARDPAVAVAEEYEAAHRKGTREALELFIAQHATPFPVLTRDTGLAELPLVYLPCLVMVLSRPNQGELPTWLAWIERRWVARRPMARD